MLNPWLPILKGLSLSRGEKEVLRRYEEDPEGRAFLPIADIFRAHHLHDEALEILMQGVERHPNFSVARVCLARDLLQKGLIDTAWRLLEEAPNPLNHNLLALKLQFRLAILLGYEERSRQALFSIKTHHALDEETKKLAEVIDISGFAAARDAYSKQLRDQGSELNLAPQTEVVPEAGLHLQGKALSDKEHAVSEILDISQDGLEASAFVFLTAEGGSQSPSADANTLDFSDGDIASIDGFHVIALEEIFRPDQSNGNAAFPGLSDGQPGIELDSSTLAEIYEKQGHFSKALSVYRRLLRVTPNSDLLRRKVSDLARLEKEQRDIELTLDPVLVDKLEIIEGIDRQIQFFNELLGRLTG